MAEPEGDDSNDLEYRHGLLDEGYGSSRVSSYPYPDANRMAGGAISHVRNSLL